MTLADTIAGAIGAKRSGGWWRTTTAHCHAGGNTRDGLAFRSPDEEPDKLNVRCYSHGCHESLEGLNRARDNLRQAAGLPPWQPSAHGHRAAIDGQRQHRTGKRVPAGSPGPKRRGKDAQRHSDGDTAPTTKDWGAHMLPWDERAGVRSRAADCPACGQADALTVWALADHPFPYCGLALICRCALTYDQLHKHIANQLAAKGWRWRQEAVYSMTDGRRRARIRTDPGKSIIWDTSEGRGPTAGYTPACWNRRGITADIGTALLVEGEKAAAACISAGMDGQLAVYSVGGIAAFKSANFAAFANGCEVTIWPDNHAEGKAAGNVAAARLAALDASIRIVDVSGLPEKGDAADIATAEIRKRIHSAREIA